MAEQHGPRAGPIQAEDGGQARAGKCTANKAEPADSTGVTCTSDPPPVQTIPPPNPSNGRTCQVVKKVDA